MKKIIRLTESDLHRIIKNSVNRIIKEDVLGDNWHEVDDESIYNNYEPFDSQEDEDDHNWGVQGEEEFDPTYYPTDKDFAEYDEDRDWSDDLDAELDDAYNV